MCGLCHKTLDVCRCKRDESFDLKQVVAIFRLESNGRGGKTVTVLDGLPKNEPFLKELTKELKTKCGVGGTYKVEDKSAKIEIQGDKRVQIKALLVAKQIKYKGV
jgi:translation initiation factor 1